MVSVKVRVTGGFEVDTALELSEEKKRVEWLKRAFWSTIRSCVPKVRNEESITAVRR